MNSERFSAAIRLFDEANRQDPNREDWEGVSHPKELLYAERMSEGLKKFAPNSSEALQLTVRCQHICRWEIPRDSYEMNRTGYLMWRQNLKKFHAKKASQILQSAGYDSETIDKVAFLLQKKQLKHHPETQILEDVICLVFLEFYFDAFSEKYTDEKLIDVLQKTWKKMSETGHQAALKLPLSDNALRLVKAALGL
tara:strand:- start:24541 stop:25128 length:588 start_codon:yes stop_codon:yes gene_type:complete